MDINKVKEIEEKIKDLKGRWPAHSVPPSLWQELEELEEALVEAEVMEAVRRTAQVHQVLLQSDHLRTDFVLLVVYWLIFFQQEVME